MAEPALVEPLDVFNQELVSNVHPPQWRNPEPAERYHLVVIGAGTAGLVTAAGAAGLGAKVALVERHMMGGDCLNVGCVPSKCLIGSARAAAMARRAAAFGIKVPQGVEADFPAVMRRLRRLRAHISHNDSVERFTNLGVDVFIGDARFDGSGAVEVSGARLAYSRAVIATGARAVRPPIPGLAEAGFLTNETVFNLTERPARLAVIGGGPIGCELAQAFQRLGSEVSLVNRSKQFLPREDPDAAQILARSMDRDGVKVFLNTAIEKVEVAGDEKRLILTRNRRTEVLAVDEILVGVGRAPNVEGLNLEGVGVEYDARAGVKVNDFLQTTNPRIYAAGDICLSHKFTHAADFAARAVIQNALFSIGPFGRKRLSSLTIPWCTYTDPEIAHVGMSEKEAEAKGIAVDVFTQELADVDRAIVDGEEDGFVKIIVAKGRDRILGATIVAAHAGDMIGEVATAMAAGMGLGALSRVIHPYPTQAEAIRKAGDLYMRTRLTPRAKKILQFLLRRRG